MKNYSLLFLFCLVLTTGEITSSQELGVIKLLIINPNPTNGIVNIEIKLGMFNSSNYTFTTYIEVYTTDGQQVTKRPIELILCSGYGFCSFYDTFYLTDCSSGIYIVRVNLPNDMLVERLLLIK
jgi:hypothetical protein